MINIAIDGPAGAGKSTIARRVSKQLGFLYVDTGAMFRAMALYFLRNQLDVTSQQVLEENIEKINVALTFIDGEQQVLLNGENVGAYIRTEEVGKVSAAIASNPHIRQRLLQTQQKIAKENNVVMDGRDIGTCVLPNAQVKIYLTASSKERAKRRYEELLKKGVDCNIDEIEADIIKRDYADMNREIAPLKQAKDAIFLDSSDMTIDEVTEFIIKEYEKKEK